MSALLQRWKFPFIALCLMLPLLACNIIADVINQIPVQDVDELGISEEDQMCLLVMTTTGFSMWEASLLCGRADRQCLYFEATVDMSFDEMMAFCTPDETQNVLGGANDGTSNIAPPAPQPASVDCSPFRLTSPLDGLPNGIATFYWDPLPGATSYVVNVAGDGAGASFGAGAGATSVAGDVSQSAIGGLYGFTITAHALIGDEVVCSHTVGVNRAAPDLGGNGGGGGGESGDSGEGGQAMGPCGVRGCIDLPDTPAEDPDDEIR